MPQQRRRFRRFGTTATAVSAGTLALVFLGAPPVYAASAAAPKTCAKGTDPATTIENWKCQWNNWQDSVKPKPTPTPTPKPAPSKTAKPVKTVKPKPVKRTAPKGGSGGTRVSVPSGASLSSGATAQSVSGGLSPYVANPQTAPQLPGVLPAPQVAAGPGSAQQTTALLAAAPQTRLMSPVSATERQNRQTLWVAAASAAAGAAAALNLSVLGRRLGRPQARGRGRR
ncbi:hypothetical protein [Actinomadura parmotrematis]|uniref:Uncharacterized protein n=1 Tax=Actinomadura parmotrematis TaxID=2864039 RepID=A0ABS7FSH1_9ACTN|nr:hypothetical protein [Actinomadura parmotrematis]MBW8483365.1 hypothetical protein [Actinomadura parmotrematis]